VSDLAPVPKQPSAERVGDSAVQAQRDLVAARARLVERLEALEQSAPRLVRLREAVRARPGLMLGGAFLLGWGLGRLLRRR